jgi:hypothetical protein
MASVSSPVQGTHQPLAKVAPPKERCSVLITKLVGIAEPRVHQLNANQGSATARPTTGNTHGRRRRAGVTR